MALDFLSHETKFFIYLYVHIKSNLKFQSVKKKKKNEIYQDCNV